MPFLLQYLLARAVFRHLPTAAIVFVVLAILLAGVSVWIGAGQ